MSADNEQKPTSGESAVPPSADPAPAGARSSPICELSGAALAILLYLVVLDTAVETCLSGSPSRWLVAGALAGYLVLSGLVWRRVGWEAKVAVTLLVLLGVVAGTAWQPEGLSHGVTLLRQPTPTVLAGATGLGLLLAGGLLVRIPRLAQLVLSVMLSAGIATTAIGPGASAAQGDPAAKAEITAAFQRLNALPSYRMKGTSRQDGTTSVVEIVRPDKTHFTVHSPQGTYEGISVGKLSAFRITAPNEPPGWQCGNSSSPTVTAFNIDKIRQDLETAPVVRKPDTVIDGTAVHSYADPSGKVALYVGAQTGLPRRIVETDRESGGSGDFHDYGVPITITMPPCK
jgi:hypothetical protein